MMLASISAKHIRVQRKNSIEMYELNPRNDMQIVNVGWYPKKTQPYEICREHGRCIRRQK
jgi:hypothetical protein